VDGVGNQGFDVRLGEAHGPGRDRRHEQLVLHAVASRAAAVITDMTAATLPSQKRRRPRWQPVRLSISCFVVATGRVTVGSQQPASKPDVPERIKRWRYRGYLAGGIPTASRGSSVQVCWIVCDVGRGGCPAG
jgi:hypothetical protein